MSSEHFEEWPPDSPSDENRKESVIRACKELINPLFTTPIAGSVPQLEVDLVYGRDDLDEIAEEIEDLALENDVWKKRFKTEATMIKLTDAVMFIGSKRTDSSALDLNCGMCGGSNCGYFYDHPVSKRKSVSGIIDDTEPTSEPDKIIDGPMCSARVDDLGFAVGSVLFKASDMFLDAAPLISLSLVGVEEYCSDSGFVVGIAFSASQKNPYVDVPPDFYIFNDRRMMEEFRRQAIIPRIIESYDYRLWEPDRKESPKLKVWPDKRKEEEEE